MDVDRVHFQIACVLKTVSKKDAKSHSLRFMPVSRDKVPEWLMKCWSGLPSQDKQFYAGAKEAFWAPNFATCDTFLTAGGIRATQSGHSSQPQHSCIYLCTHLQLLHLPLKHLLPEFMKDMTRFPGWIRAGAAFLFLNFNNFLAAVSKLFYLQSHFPCHSSTSGCPSGLVSPSAGSAALWHHVLPTFPSSASTSFLHSHLTLLLTSLPSPQLLPSSVPLLHLHPTDAAMLPSFLLAWAFTPQNSVKVLLRFQNPSRLPFAPVPHPWVCAPKLSSSSLASRYVRSDKNCLWWFSDFKGWSSPCQGETVIFPACFIGENCGEWRNKVGQGQLNLIIY